MMVHNRAALLREFALVETVHRNERSGLRIQEFRSSGYYFPLLDRPGWGAWGVVVEMALRRMAGLEQGRPADAGQSAYPVALVTSRGAEFVKTAIVLRGPSAYRLGRADIPGFYRRIHEWQLMAWVTGERISPGTPTAEEVWQRISPGTPTAEEVWQWAFLPAAELRSQSTRVWFGELHEPKDQNMSAIAKIAESLPL
jgi:hypothetical protein